VAAYTFICANCGGVFESAWTDEEARAESERLFPGVPVTEMAEICDDCFEKFEQWRLRDQS